MGINIALAGNPNCGKTTMFNELTGANQYVGNWPGVTVEKKEGKYTRDKDVTVTDLPGVYSLSPYTPEEIVTRDYLLSGQPDVVVNLVDATNLERNLYLTTQILDLGLPVVVALNMMDLVRKNGDEINVEGLSQRLGCPVVETTALKGRGVEELIAKAVEAAKAGQPATPELRFSGDAEAALAQVSDILGSRVKPAQARWFAIKLLEGEELTIDALGLPADDLARIDAIREALEEAEDDDAESIVTNERYDNIGEVCAACVKKSPKALTTTQKIDRVVTNRVLGLPIFIVIMFLVYYISVSTVGTLVTDWANDGLFGDGWLYTNTESYEADAEEYEGYQTQIDAYLEAAEKDGLDVEGFTAALEAEEPNAEDEEGEAIEFVEPAAEPGDEVQPEDEAGELEKETESPTEGSENEGAPVEVQPESGDPEEEVSGTETETEGDGEQKDNLVAEQPITFAVTRISSEEELPVYKVGEKGGLDGQVDPSLLEGKTLEQLKKCFPMRQFSRRQ